MKHILCFLGLFLTVYIIAFISSGDIVTKNLFQNLNIVQVFTPIFQITIAVGITYFIHIILNKKNKSTDILIEMIDDYSSLINTINEIVSDYINKKETDKKTEHEKLILWHFKQASMKVESLKEIMGMYENIKFIYEYNAMICDLRELKKSITDDPFKQEKDYSGTQKSKILSNFNKIERMLSKEKINLFK